MMTNKEALTILDEVFYQGKYLLMDDPKFFEAICRAEEALKKVEYFENGQYENTKISHSMRNDYFRRNENGEIM